MDIGVSIFTLWVLYLGIYNYIQAGTKVLTMYDFLNKPIKSAMGKTLQSFSHKLNLSLPDSELHATLPFGFPVNMNGNFY